MRGRPSRRSFLKQIGVGASVLPLAATLDAAGVAAAMAPQTGGGWDEIRAQFSFRESMVPMNAGNLCPPPRVVADRLVELTRDIDADVSYGNRAKFSRLREESREKVAAHLNVTPDEIALVRNTTEANGTVISGLSLEAGDEIVVWTRTIQRTTSHGMSWRPGRACG